MSDILCRWGGEEFTLLLVGSNIEDGVKICEKIRVQVQNHPFIQDRQVTVSMGITHYLPNDNLETFVARADNALYLAKRTGRNRTERHVPRATLHVWRCRTRPARTRGHGGMVRAH